MTAQLPRLVLAGTNSGCGKTTVTCAILQALVNRGCSVAAAKCGPDYIDPMFHSRIIGAKSSNLDPFFFDDNTLRYLLAENSRGCELAVIEGVMGYYDGLGLTSTRASTFELAQKTESPVVLVVNARGAALSVLAAIQGFLQFQLLFLGFYPAYGLSLGSCFGDFSSYSYFSRNYSGLWAEFWELF